MKMKFYFCVAAIILCGISMSLEFINVFNLEIISTHNIKGAYCALLGLIVLIYLTYIKKNQIVGYVISFGGYAYTMYSVYDLFNGLNDIGLNLFKFLRPGFYVYTLSLIALIISLFVKNKNGSTNKIDVQVIEKGITEIKQQFNEQDLSKNILLGNYVLGFKGYKFDSVVLLRNLDKEQKLYLESSLDNKNIIRNTINYNKIKSIDYQVQMDMQTRKPDAALQSDRDTANLLLSLVIFSAPVAVAGNKLLGQFTDEYDKTTINNHFHVKITFLDENNEEKNIVIKTTKNPMAFVNKVKDDCQLMNG